MKTIVIGGGPSGMMAAIMAKKYSEVILIEKMPKLGTKLLLTGNSRCNLTNLKEPLDFLKRCNKESKFLTSSLTRFSPKDIVSFFTERGCTCHEEDNNRIFPKSNSAQDVLDVLVNELNGVQVITNCRVLDFKVEDHKIISINTSKGIFYADHYIIATGGASFPGTGSEGEGYQWLKDMGHSITDLSPCEVPLVCQDSIIQSKKLQGVSLSNKEVISGKKRVKGDLIFTHFGFSGPAILELSEWVESCITIKHDNIFFIPKNAKELNVPKIYFEWLLQTQPFLNKPFEQQNKAERQKTLEHFQCQTFNISGPLGLKQAFVTKGGVKLNQLDPKTMKSKLIHNLSVCGELLNCHGIVGGYNLTIAFSSGAIAGLSIKELY